MCPKTPITHGSNSALKHRHQASLTQRNAEAAVRYSSNMLLSSHRQGDGKGASFAQFGIHFYASAQFIQGLFGHNQSHS